MVCELWECSLWRWSRINYVGVVNQPSLEFQGLRRTVNFEDMDLSRCQSALKTTVPSRRSLTQQPTLRSSAFVPFYVKPLHQREMYANLRSLEAVWKSKGSPCLISWRFPELQQLTCYPRVWIHPSATSWVTSDAYCPTPPSTVGYSRTFPAGFLF